MDRRKHPELNLDTVFLEEAAMLHDIGIFLTHAPGIQCFGTEPYICHGYLGAGLVRKEGFPRHALVCERHTGAGLSLKDIMDQKLPVPHREMLPVSMEEQVICFADKFFRKPISTVRKLWRGLVRASPSMEMKVCNVLTIGVSYFFSA